MTRRTPSLAAVLFVQVVFAAALAVSYATMAQAGRAGVERALGRAATEIVRIERKTPLVVEPLYDEPSMVPDTDLAAVLEKLQPRFPAEKMKPNFVEHALRTWGQRAKFKDPRAMSGATMVEFLTDHGKYLKSWGEETADRTPLLENRKNGIAIRIGSDPYESVHHDHWLASLTEAGVSLDEKIFAPGRPNGTLNDVLQEALRDFRLDERETEWSAMAFGFWIAPQRGWRTTDGREVTFDRLARRLIRGDRRLGVCNGTHRVYSLAVLLRLDESHDILSDEVRDEVWKHLESIRDLIGVCQFDDGHWPTNWSKGEEAKTNLSADKPYQKIIATGHHLEWLAIAPKELHPPRELIERAARWVIEDTKQRTDEEILERYTFYSHVANALALWRKTHPADFWMSWEARGEANPSGPAIPPPPE